MIEFTQVYLIRRTLAWRRFRCEKWEEPARAIIYTSTSLSNHLSRSSNLHLFPGILGLDKGAITCWPKIIIGRNFLEGRFAILDKASVLALRKAFKLDKPS